MTNLPPALEAKAREIALSSCMWCQQGYEPKGNVHFGQVTCRRLAFLPLAEEAMRVALEFARQEKGD